ncbi:MAG: sugar phosphate isomerase/epimerase [Firmicutes bacterium]|nr:sugar phosphate isomerase/epimerase [Bacillota bacterium]
MLIGVRAHDFGKLAVEELAKKISAQGFSSIQLALAKAIAGIDSDAGRLTPGLARYIGDIFHRHNIQIAVLGCYINPVHPDLEFRRQSLNRFKEHLRYARDFGCSIVGTETGSLNADFSFHPENQGPKAFQLLIESLSELVEEAEKFGVLVGIEGVTTYTIPNPQTMKRVLDTINSNNLQVIFDPVNLLDASNYQNQDQIMKASFELFGDRITIIHTKDFALENGKKRSAIPGQGLFHFEYLLGWLKKNKPYINILLEDGKPETFAESVRYIEDVYKRL